MSLTPSEYVFQVRSRFLRVVSRPTGEKGVSERYAAEQYALDLCAKVVAAARVYSK